MSVLDFFSAIGDYLFLTIVVPFYRVAAASDSRYFYIYVISGLLLAWLYRANMPIKGSFWKTLTDKKIWKSRSAVNDYYILFINTLFILTVAVGISTYITGLTQWIIDFFRAVGVTGQVNDSSAWLAGLALTVVLFIVKDFVYYYLHYLAHVVPSIWEFHKVHHSAEVLNFTTADRTHPVEIAFFGVFVTLTIATVNGLFFSFFGDNLTITTVMGANVLAFLGNVIGGALRHSPFPLSYGKRLEDWLISPGMHHIHHSDDPRHFDTNMGRTLSVWDKMFGTHLYYEKDMQLSFGIGEETKEYHSLYEIYVRPFRQFSKYLPKAGATQSNNHETPKNEAMNETVSDTATQTMSNTTVSVLYILLISLFLFIAISIPGQLAFSNSKTLISPQIEQQSALDLKLENLVANALPAKKEIFIEDLTSAEVRYLIKKGYDSIIIPTGGTEQNGLHMILGKHNYVVKYTANHIAKQAGKILVAPVMAYVPEGNIAKKEGHMAFAGTISLPEILFENILEYSARSFKTHGFKTIYLLGDSGGNQRAQKKVATRLTKIWQKEGVQVIHLSEYYAKNKQIDHLLKQGQTKASIGAHAGIRDSAELMFVKPEGIRTPILTQLNGLIAGFTITGHTGLPAKANLKIGRKMIALKIDAGLKQIKLHRNNVKNASAKPS